jgi:hypothetical protein
MPTEKPRITITLEKRVYEVLRRLSAASGESMSSCVTQFLDVAIAPMERMVVVLEQAKVAPRETKEAVRASILRAEAKLLPGVIAAAVEQNDMFLAEWSPEAIEAREAILAGERRKAEGPKAAAERRPQAPERLVTPVPVTRGSGLRKAAKKRRTHAGV